MQTMVSYVDLAMVGSMGVNAAASVTINTSLLWMINGIIWGPVTGFSVLAATALGQNDPEKVKKIMRQAMTAMLLLGLLMLALIEGLAQFFARVMGAEADIIPDARAYLMLIGFGIPFQIMLAVCSGLVRGLGDTKTPMLYNILFNLLNIVLNYLLIFGLNVGGAQIIPRCGIEGAAVATLISRIVEIGIVVVYVFFMDQKLRPGLGELLRGNKLLLMDYLKYGLPVIGGGVVWAVNVSVQGAIIGKLGVSTAITAYSVANTFFSVITVAVFGLSAASSIVIGKAVGAGDVEKVKQYAKTLQLIFLGLGVITGGILFACRWLLPVVYPKYSPEALDMSRQFLIVLAVTTIGTSYQACSLTGIVRAGGDTAFVFMNDSIWVPVVLFTAYLAGYVFGAPPWLVFALLKGDQIYKCFVAIFKVNRFKWIRNITRTEAPQQA